MMCRTGIPRLPRMGFASFGVERSPWSIGHDSNRPAVPGFHPRRPRGLHQRRARQGRDQASDVQAADRHPCAHLRHAARGGDSRACSAFSEDGEWNAMANKLPRTQQDWWDKRRATDTVLEAIGGVVTRVGDETVGEMWSLFDGQDVLNEVDPQFSANIRRHIEAVLQCRSVPRLGQHRSQGRSLQAAAGAGSGHAAARRQGDRRRHRGARRQIRDRRGLRQPGLHQADHRQLGQLPRSPTTRSDSSAIWARPT